MRKKGFMYVLIGIMLLVFTMAPLVGVAAGNTVIMVNNSVVSSNVGSANYNGILLMPAKELASALGGTYTYDNGSMTGVVKSGENELVFRLDNSVAKYNGKNIQAPAPMKIIDARLMVPVNFVAEKLGAEVYYRTDKNLTLVYRPVNGKLVYKVMAGDTLWIISRIFGTTVEAIKNLNGLNSDMIYIGQNLIIKNMNSVAEKIAAQTTKSATLWKGPGFSYSEVNYLPAWTAITVTGKTGDWFKVETPKGNGYIYYTVMSVIQNVSDTAPNSSYFSGNIPVDTSKDFVTYENYIVQKGDSIWAISEKKGITDYELAAANNLSRTAILSIGQVLKIPVHNIGIKTTPAPQYGEVLDWFTEAQYVFPVGKVGKLIDLETGKSFMIQRTMGANHADSETVTIQDTQTMKEIFGGYWNWNRRSFVLEVDGRRFAVSVAGMPHAGVDGVPYYQNVANRSDNWGYGPNYDKISGNGMDGHFDVYFLNCLRHKDNQIDPAHQYGVLKAGGLQ